MIQNIWGLIGPKNVEILEFQKVEIWKDNNHDSNVLIDQFSPIINKSWAGVGIGTLVGANAPTPPYGGGYRPHTPLKSACRPVGLPNGFLEIPKVQKMGFP